MTRDLSGPVLPISGWPRCFDPVPRCSRGAGALLPRPQGLPARPKWPSSDVFQRQPGEEGCSCPQATTLAGSRARGHGQQLVPQLARTDTGGLGTHKLRSQRQHHFLHRLCHVSSCAEGGQGVRLSLSLPCMQAHCGVVCASPCPNGVIQQVVLAVGERKCKESNFVQPS